MDESSSHTLKPVTENPRVSSETARRPRPTEVGCLLTSRLVRDYGGKQMSISDGELEETLRDGDSVGRLECRDSLSDKTGICEAICAFWNDLAARRQPGVVVGVDDDGEPVGLGVSDELLRDFADLKSGADSQICPSMHVP